MVITTIKERGLQNPYDGAGTGPTLTRTGIWWGMSIEGSGLWQHYMTSIEDARFDADDATEGVGIEFTTGAVSGNNAGLKQTNEYYRRSWGNYMILRIKPSTTTAIGCFVGWLDTDTDFVESTILDNLSGCGVGKRTGDTNWQVITNDGDATTNYADTGLAFAASAVTIVLELDSTSFRSKIGTTQNTAVTTEIPASTTMLKPQIEIETTEAVDKEIIIYPIYSRVGP